jgi:GAF domain-containing protein
MVQQSTFSGNRLEDYPLAVRQVVAFWEADLPLTSNLANISALLRQCLDRINWVGFYLWQEAGSQLILGPFQGLPACTRIPVGKGVCGTAAASRKTQRVANVHEFPGHIACDSASRSEIVVPVVKQGTVLGVLDIDSPEESRFDAVDQEWLEKLVQALVPLWPSGD